MFAPAANRSGRRQSLSSNAVRQGPPHSLLAEESVPGAVAKAPPFDGFRVGNNWRMRLDRVPRAQ